VARRATVAAFRMLRFYVSLTAIQRRPPPSWTRDESDLMVSTLFREAWARRPSGRIDSLAHAVDQLQARLNATAQPAHPTRLGAEQYETK
jgi:hypothetical protein